MAELTEAEAAAEIWWKDQHKAVRVIYPTGILKQSFVAGYNNAKAMYHDATEKGDVTNG